MTLSAKMWSREIIAGLVTALALVPEVISFSVISGVSPGTGLLASVVLCLTLSVAGGRPAMVTAAAGSVALVAGPLVRVHGLPYLLPAVLLCGILQIILSCAGFTAIMRFIKSPVMDGFVNALGVLIFVAQLPSVAGRGPVIYALFVVAVIITALIPRLFPRIPAPLIAVIIISLLVNVTGCTVPMVGDQGTVFSGHFALAHLMVPLNIHTLAIIFPTALSMALVGLMETLLTATLVDAKTKTCSDKTRESVALGTANLLAGFLGGVAGCAMVGQTMVNIELGKARTRLSTLVAGIILLLLITVLNNVLTIIPMVALAGIMVVVALKTINWQSIRPAVLKTRPWSETLVMLLSVGATVLTGNLALGVISGVILTRFIVI